MKNKLLIITICLIFILTSCSITKSDDGANNQPQIGDTNENNSSEDNNLGDDGLSNNDDVEN